MNGMRPASDTASRLRLRDVVEQRPEPQGVPAGELVGERLRQQLADRVRVLPQRFAWAALELEHLREHRPRVVVDVEVMEAALLHAAEIGDLGQHHGGRPRRVHQRQPGEDAVRGDDPFQLGEHALRGDGRQRVRARPGRAQRLALHDEVELAGDSREPHHPQRIARERVRRDHPHDAARDRSCNAAERVDVFAAAKRLGDRVDREVALGEVILDRLPGERDQVDLPGAVVGDDPPDAEAGGELEHVATGAASDPLRGGLDELAREHHVQVGAVDPARTVADGAAHQPGAGTELG